jgi:preprotein translocase subunit SecG
MSILFIALMLVFFLVCAALVYFVLLQEPKQGGLSSSMGGSGSSDFLSARGTTGGLVQLTVYAGAIFLFVAVLLNIIRL